jgi:phosphate uptake regulator
MKRKIMKMAGTTYVVSIPLKWANKYNLKKGDEIDIDDDNGNLIIRFSESEKKKKTYSVDIKNNYHTSNKLITNLYRHGYDEFKIKFNDYEYIEKIPQIMFDNTIGLAIVEQKDNSVTIRDLSGNNIDDLDKIHKRVWFLIKDLANEVIEGIKNSDFKKLESIKSKEKVVNQFVNYCTRLISNENNINNRKSFVYYYLTRQLENISDAYKHISVIIVDKKIKPDLAFVETFESVNKLFDEFFSVYYNYSIEKTEKLILNYKRLIKKIDQNQKNNKKDEYFLIFTYLQLIVRKISELTSPMIELNL